MHQFKPATERILRLRDRIRDRVLKYDSERLRIITESTIRPFIISVLCFSK